MTGTTPTTSADNNAISPQQEKQEDVKAENRNGGRSPRGEGETEANVPGDDGSPAAAAAGTDGKVAAQLTPKTDRSTPQRAPEEVAPPALKPESSTSQRTPNEEAQPNPERGNSAPQTAPGEAVQPGPETNSSTPQTQLDGPFSLAPKQPPEVSSNPRERSPVAGKTDAIGEDHLSRKYTKEEILARHWGLSLEQMRRVKALILMGVSEEDIVVAERLLKMGRDNIADTPWTKEEQLLGYSASQRQRIKALHTLGLTEEAFDNCRSVFLSSLGHTEASNMEHTAAVVARVADGEDHSMLSHFSLKKYTGIHPTGNRRLLGVSMRSLGTSMKSGLGGRGEGRRSSGSSGSGGGSAAFVLPSHGEAKIFMRNSSRNSNSSGLRPQTSAEGQSGVMLPNIRSGSRNMQGDKSNMQAGGGEGDRMVPQSSAVAAYVS